MKKSRNIIISIIIITVVIITGTILYLFLWGFLFPYSPVITGFTKHELSQSIIYIQHGSSYNDFQRIDILIPEVEAFHELKFKKKPELFIFNDKNSYLRHSTSRARFCAFPSGRLIISPWALKEAVEGKISLNIYLRHELSHVLLFQYKGLLSPLTYPNWLLEGIAVYCADQMGTSFYPGKEETYRLIRQGNYMPPQYFHTGKEDRVRLDVKYRATFIYSEFACIVDYLIEQNGKEKFIVYMKSLLKSNDHDKIFKDIYGIEFEQFLRDFKNHVCNSEKK